MALSPGEARGTKYHTVKLLLIFPRLIVSAMPHLSKPVPKMKGAATAGVGLEARCKQTRAKPSSIPVRAAPDLLLLDTHSSQAGASSLLSLLCSVLCPGKPPLSPQLLKNSEPFGGCPAQRCVSGGCLERANSFVCLTLFHTAAFNVPDEGLMT
jgi:hypothetical protein